MIGGSQRFLPNAKTTEERAEVELSDDPISGTEDELSHIGPSKRIHAPSMKQSYLQVEIPANPLARKTTGYQGTANRLPPRRQENGSPHFIPDQSRGSNSSITRPSKNQATVNLSNPTRQTKVEETDDSGVDELALEQGEVQKHKQVAKDLLALNDRFKRSSNSSKGKQSHPGSI